MNRATPPQDDGTAEIPERFGPVIELAKRLLPACWLFLDLVAGGRLRPLPPLGGPDGAETVRTSTAPIAERANKARAETPFGAVDAPDLAGICLPVGSGDEHLGVLTVARRAATPMDPAETDAARLVAALAAEGIRTARLAETVRAQRSEIEFLSEIQGVLTSGLDLEGVYRAMGDRVRFTLKADATEILMLDPESRMIHVHYSFYRNGYKTVDPFPLGLGMTSQVLTTGQALLLNTKEEQAGNSYILSDEDDVTESYLGVPILVDGVAIGVVSVQSYPRRRCVGKSLDHCPDGQCHGGGQGTLSCRRNGRLCEQASADRRAHYRDRTSRCSPRRTNCRTLLKLASVYMKTKITRRCYHKAAPQQCNRVTVGFGPITSIWLRRRQPPVPPAPPTRPLPGSTDHRG